MTTLDPNVGMLSEFQTLAARLEAAGSRFRMAACVGAAGKCLAIVAPVFTVVFFVIGIFAPPAWVNLCLLVIATGVLVLAYLRFLHRPLFQRPTYAQIARWIEENAPNKSLELHNELINAVLLAQEYQTSAQALANRQSAPRHSPWIPAVIRELEKATAPLALESTIPWRKHGHAWLKALAVLVACLLMLVLFRPTFVHAFAVLTHPNKSVAMIGTTKILSVEPGNDTILAGQPVNFRVSVETPGNKVVDSRITIHYASGKTATYAMPLFGSDNSQYAYALEAVAESLDYVIAVGDSKSERYHIDVMPDIHLVGFRLTTTPPAYTGREKSTQTLPGKGLTSVRGTIEVPMGSTVEVAAAVDIPVKEVLVDFPGGSPQSMTADSDHKVFSYKFLAKDNIRYSLRVNDAANRTLKRFPDDGAAGAADAANGGTYFAITAVSDPPPTVQITEPARDLDAKPGDQVPLAAQAADESYGLTELRLETAKGPNDEFHTVKTWPISAGLDGKPARSFGVKHLLDLPAKDFRFGDSLRYRFVAVDNRDLLAISSDLGHQPTPSQVFSINFTDTAAVTAKTTRAWDELRKKLNDILDRQVKLREQANGFAVDTKIDDAHKLALTLGDGQKGIRTDLGTVAKDFPFEPSMKLIQRSLQVLVVEDATSAVDRAADIVLLSDAKALMPLGTKVRQHQSRIIDVLQTLLAISATEQKRTTPIVSKDGGDIPNEAKEAWKKLAEDLKQFQKEQAKVVQATADLAKKPKDQYDQNDKDKFKELAAIEDKWEKFMNERMADTSKIGEQDQANATVADEMVQMKVELAMAKDALNGKATEMAIPIEENGLELAKSLDAHLERWLGHQPDRLQWKDEEFTKQVETPAAELPKQLQDMVGELMDNEEDLTEQMESTASKANDSLNKGAGWDAMDGPISNMSAQGVTGNQMPKNNEIQGRSGEGREGKASGEMVGDTAEGKGGRRTPTRMTPEPFAGGKVDDKSKDPAGGATGGGKKGGVGGEGLEGQAPDDPSNVKERLAGKQAALRNDAERLNLQMRAQGFNNFKLFEAAVYMQKVEESLKQNRYENALYFQKKAVQTLNTAKVLAEGEVHVTMDTTPAVNEKVQKEMQDALNGVMPKGYSDPVKAYFEKLSNQSGQ